MRLLSVLINCYHLTMVFACSLYIIVVKVKQFESHLFAKDFWTMLGFKTTIK